MQEAAYATLPSSLEAFWQSGKVPPRTGNASHGRVPINVYPTNDGYVAMNLAVEEHWHSLLQAMGRDDLRDDIRFNSPAARLKNREETDALLHELPRVRRAQINDALQWIVDWKRQYDASADVRELTLSQIRSYQQALQAA